MGKSLELLGLATFNIIIAIILSATFLKKSEEAISTLTTPHIEKFVNDITEISGGIRKDMDSFEVTSYLMAHIANDSRFSSTIDYNMPDISESGERILELDKLHFISNTQQGMKAFTRHEAAVKIDYIQIADNGKSARVTTTSHERGVIPIEDNFGETQFFPVTGTSYCEQKLVLSEESIIQMAEAVCSTNIDFINSDF